MWVQRVRDLLGVTAVLAATWITVAANWPKH
jgi:hypothetical protein